MLLMTYLREKKCVLSESKEVNVKVFNLITRINGVKSFIKHISSDCKCNFNSNPKLNSDKGKQVKKVLHLQKGL